METTFMVIHRSGPKNLITVTIVSIRIRTNGFGMHVEIETDVSQGVE